jgi:lipid-binding SYLF domain-containing protein
MKTKLLLTALLTFTFSTLSFAADTLESLTQKSAVSANVLRQIMQIPERSIPLDLLHEATCIATIPGLSFLSNSRRALE